MIFRVDRCDDRNLQMIAPRYPTGVFSPSTGSCRCCSPKPFAQALVHPAGIRAVHPMKDRKQEALQRLARLEGQVRGIARMIEEDRYCIDILNQALAVRAALSQVEMLILQDHADYCVEDAIHASDPQEQRRKFRELVDVFEKVCR